uniref:Uncharacterized protein n=1 Tax=Stomoxys calcitrans TaxID=35570 RepID=A0A1I8NQU2_STOCA
MPLIVQRQQQHSILKGSQQHSQQRQHTEENCTCANILANKNFSSTATTITVIDSFVSSCNSNNTKATATNSNINISSCSSRSNSNITMNQMPFKRAVHNIAKDVVREAPAHKTSIISTSYCQSNRDPNGSNNNNTFTSLAVNSNKISEFSYCATEVVAATQTLPPTAPPSTAASSFFGGILVSNLYSSTTPNITSAATSSFETSSPTPSSSSSSAVPSSLPLAVYLEMKKYCRRFLIVITLICLLHSCLLWNSAAAAISNR